MTEIYTEADVALVRKHADGYEIVELCDSHETLRRKVVRLEEAVRDMCFEVRSVAGTLEAERADWERRAADDGPGLSYHADSRRIDQLREELAWQRDKLRRLAQSYEPKEETVDG